MLPVAVVMVAVVVVLECSVVADCAVETIPTVGAVGMSEYLESMLCEAGILLGSERGLKRSPSADTAIKAATTIHQSSAITPSLPYQGLLPWTDEQVSAE